MTRAMAGLAVLKRSKNGKNVRGDVKPQGDH